MSKKKKEYGKFCCCPPKIGMHVTGLVSAGLLVYYFVLFVTSIANDNFNWRILLWVFAIGFPRVVFYFMIFADTIYRRRMHATTLVATTALQLLLCIIDQFSIAMHHEDYCDRVWAVSYMKHDWSVECGWSIVMYEICMISFLMFYIYASWCSVGYFHEGFEHQALRKIETERLEQRAKEDGDFENFGKQSKKDKSGLGGGQLDITGEKTIDNSALMQPSMLGYQAMPQQQQQM